jgi:signal transduction histidine kinase
MMNTIRVLAIGGGEALPMREGGAPGPAERVCVIRKPTLAEGLGALEISSFDFVLLDLSLTDIATDESVTKILRMAQDLPVVAFMNGGEAGGIVEGVRGSGQGCALNGGQADSLKRTIEYATERKQFIAARDAGPQPIRDNKLSVVKVSHEFRNALACIFQFGNILRGGLAGEMSEEQREYLGIMLENATRIRSLLDGPRPGVRGGPGQCEEKIGPLPEEAN